MINQKNLIFTNLYRKKSPSLSSAKKSGDWILYDNFGIEKHNIKGKDWQEFIDERSKNSPQPVGLCL